MSLEERDEVPPAKSPRSTSATLSPRIAASRAIATPLIPPPITATSNSSLRKRARLRSRSNGCSAFKGPLRREGLFVRLFLEGVAFLAPGIRVIVVAAHFPEPAAIPIAELDRAHPFGALPGIELRHDEPQRPAMIGFQVAAVVAMRQHHVVVQKFFNRQVGGVSAIAMDDDIASLRQRRGHLCKVGDFDAFPQVVESLPGCYAVKIGNLARLGHPAELLIL